MIKKLFGILFLGLILSACSDAEVVTNNLKKAADNFEINRRIVFYNGISGEYILSIEGLCSMDLNSSGTAFNAVCRTGPSSYKRHTLVLSDNTTTFVEQLEPVVASAYHYRVIFKPSVIIPDIEIK